MSPPRTFNQQEETHGSHGQVGVKTQTNSTNPTKKRKSRNYCPEKPADPKHAGKAGESHSTGCYRLSRTHRPVHKNQVKLMKGEQKQEVMSWKGHMKGRPSK